MQKGKAQGTGRGQKEKDGQAGGDVQEHQWAAVRRSGGGCEGRGVPGGLAPQAFRGEAEWRRGDL